MTPKMAQTGSRRNPNLGFQAHPLALGEAGSYVDGAATLDLCTAFWRRTKDEHTAYWDSLHPGKRARVGAWMKGQRNSAGLDTSNPVDATGNTLARIILHEFTHTFAAGMSTDVRFPILLVLLRDMMLT